MGAICAGGKLKTSVIYRGAVVGVAIADFTLLDFIRAGYEIYQLAA